ncbi:LOW QUALITY PROTEIN: uncharacterized protein Kul [Palaemon carinicauda]|uniref:LOW QUALITY PROTEIN: uncharacterized protein Kul n=1 Tax=Palaemon carinicauda TaxID=392227 RepID=UPI0035B5DF53
MVQDSLKTTRAKLTATPNKIWMSVRLVLSDHILHFEPVFYDETHLRSQHHRAKRDANHVVSLHFTAHNRLFKLRLRRDTSIFADDVTFESTDGPIDFDLDKVYSGTLEDDHLAEVEGVVTSEGLFDGHVATQNELYYLEPANRYLEGAEFHSVMYKASDVAHPSLSRCSSQQLHLNGRVHSPWDPPSSFPNSQIDKGIVAEEEAERDDGDVVVHSKAEELSSFHSSISSSVASLPHRAGAVPSPKLQDVNPKHKAVTFSKSLYDSTSDNVDFSSSKTPGASTATSSFPHSPSYYSSSSSKDEEYGVSDGPRKATSPSSSDSHSTSSTCYTKSSCRRSYTSTERSTFDKKSSHFVAKKFKQLHFQDPSPAGAQSNTRPQSRNKNKTIMASPDNASSSALDSDGNHIDFDLVYEPTSEKDAIFSKPSRNFTRRKTGVRPPVLPELERHLWLKNSRKKRSTVDPQKTTCMLYLQADHLFFEKIGSEEKCIDTITRHVQRVNNIYKVTDFDSDKAADKIGFMIKRIKIHTPNALNDPSYRFPGNYGVEKFLELFSEEDYDAFCLAYMFTYRDFEGGTLGLAWTGDLKNAGGVCEKNGHYRGSLKSLNTGIVTLLNYGKHVPPAVSHVTLAHEIGHNFGSPHDPESDTRCTPGGPDGNYIMYARATSGDKQNNNKFSPCSLRQINSVLNSKARDTKGCFTQPQLAICGNGVVENGEDCDCGWEEDCEETCCYPMKTNPKKGQTPCTLRPNKTCSPSQGPCCTNDCHFKERDKCRDDNGCRDSSYCNGRYAQCPPSTNKPNKTICNEEFVCYKGECSGSICLAYGLESCQCSRKRGDPITKSCELCCKHPGENQPCKSSFEWNDVPYDIPDMYAKAGTPCNDYKGYCDVFKKCREVDPSGPLATLRGLLLSDESLANLQRWIIEHWYAVLFVIFAVMVLLVAIIKVFGKNPKKKKVNTSKTVRHKNNGTAQYTIPATGATANGTSDGTANHVVHPTVVRTNLPFKRKVNEVRRAATKAKRAAKSQLSRPTKKSSRRPDGTVTSPTESEKSGPGIMDAAAVPSGTRVKDRLSSRVSIFSFKTFRPKSLSPDKHKSKNPDKRKSKSGNDKKSKVKSSKGHHRSHSPDKKRRAEGRSAESPDKHRRSRSPNKRASLEDDRKKSRNRSVSPDKIRRSASPDKMQRHRARSPDKHRKMSEGNWLINKFLADEEKTAKPIVNGSLVGSLNGSISSVSAVIGGPTSSPQISLARNGSTRGLLTSDSNRASPLRGFVNEAFISSPRGARTHSSLRVTKSVSPEGLDFDFGPSKYRRSISMEAYNKQCASPDKRKRPVLDEGLSPDKRRRFSSPEKTQRVPSPPKEYRFSHSDKTRHTLDMEKRRSISPPTSKPNSYSSVPERLREKLSLITASPSGSVASILPPSEPVDTVSLHSSNQSTHSIRGQPKDWV